MFLRSLPWNDLVSSALRYVVSTIPACVVSLGVVANWFKARIEAGNQQVLERLKADLAAANTRDIEQRKAALTFDVVRAKRRHGFLPERQGVAVDELHRLLTDLNRAILALTEPVKLKGDLSDEELFGRFEQSRTLAAEAFLDKRLFLPPDLAGHVDELLLSMQQRGREHGFIMQRSKRAWPDMQRLSELAADVRGPVQTAISGLETMFRTLLARDAIDPGAPISEPSAARGR